MERNLRHWQHTRARVNEAEQIIPRLSHHSDGIPKYGVYRFHNVDQELARNIVEVHVLAGDLACVHDKMINVDWYVAEVCTRIVF